MKAAERQTTVTKQKKIKKFPNFKKIIIYNHMIYYVIIIYILNKGEPAKIKLHFYGEQSINIFL